MPLIRKEKTERKTDQTPDTPPGQIETLTIRRSKRDALSDSCSVFGIRRRERRYNRLKALGDRRAGLSRLDSQVPSLDRVIRQRPSVRCPWPRRAGVDVSRVRRLDEEQSRRDRNTNPDQPLQRRPRAKP
jgi:hypothetical protein